MLQFLHKFRIVFLAILVAASFFLVFSDILSPLSQGSQARHVVKVNDREFTYDDYARARRMIDETYRRMLGNRYHLFMQVDLSQLAVERLISEALFEQAAEKMGFIVEPRAVESELRQQFSAVPGLSNENIREHYNLFLSTIGMTASEFESSLERSLLRDQFTRLLQDAAFTSRREAEASIALDLTKYDASYAVSDPATFLSVVAAPTEDELRSYYDKHATEFELPQRVAYDFIALDPKDFASLVEIFPEDVELYYTDHEDEFMTSEEFRFRAIFISNAAAPGQSTKKSSQEPAAPSALEREVLKKKAEDALSRIKSGGDFSAEAKQISSDPLSSSEGGDLGFLSRDALRARLGLQGGNSIFDLTDGAVSDVLETRDGFVIVKREALKPSQPRPFEEVRGEIESKIRLREAPAYTSSKALEFVALLRKARTPLESFAAEHSLKRHATEGIVEASKDPVAVFSPSSAPTVMKGLTEKVLENPDEKYQVIELPEYSVLVEIKEFKDTEVPALDAVKDRVRERIMNERAKEKAREIAAGLITDLSSPSAAALSSAAAAKGLVVQTQEGITRSTLRPPLSTESARKMIFGQHANAPFTISEPLEHEGKFFVVRVDRMTPPSPDEIKSRLTADLTQENRRAEEFMAQSVLAYLKAQSKIDVDQTVFAGG